MIKTTSTPAAKAKVLEALRLVEEAQRALDRAAQCLSPLRHGGDLYEECGQIQHSMNTFRHRLDVASRSRGQMSVDSEPEAE